MPSTTADESVRLDKRIADYEAHHLNLDRQTGDMQNLITNLEAQIKDTL
jgi:hypothetical protein